MSKRKERLKTPIRRLHDDPAISTELYFEGITTVRRFFTITVGIVGAFTGDSTGRFDAFTRATWGLTAARCARIRSIRCCA